MGGVFSGSSSNAHRRMTSSNSDELFTNTRELKPSTSTRVSKVPHVSSFLGKAGNLGLEVLDTLGSSLTNLNAHSEFVSNMASRERKVSIVAFEVAKTIVKGSNLMQSLSEENIQILKKEILHSQGVQLLVSTDTMELLRIAASDKREELDVFSREVVRFGNLCIDRQWHNLDRFGSRLDMDMENKLLREDMEITMQELTNLSQYTLVVKKLVDIVIFIPQAIAEAFEENVPSSMSIAEGAHTKPETLGVAGLALHYANLVTQMSNIAARPISLPLNMRDNLYNGLPASVKAALRSCLQSLNSKEIMTMPQIKAEMETTLQWLVPVATDTINFGRVGEWEVTGNEFGKKTTWRLQTLYHADIQKTGRYILDLIIWLHRLISLVRFRDKDPKYISSQSPPPTTTNNNNNGVMVYSDPSRLKANGKLQKVQISLEDRNLLEEVMKRRMWVPGTSKSQEFVMVKKKKRATDFASSRSMGEGKRDTQTPAC